MQLLSHDDAIVVKWFALKHRIERIHQREMTDTEIAAALDIAPSTLSAWKNNGVTRFDASILRQFRKVFGVKSVSEIIEFADVVNASAGAENDNSGSV